MESQSPQQQPQPQPQQWVPVTKGPTLAEMIVPLGRGLRSAGRDIWQLGIMQGGPEAWRDLRSLLAHPPRWFLIVSALCALFVIVFCVLSLTGAVASQADYLRHLMDQLP